MDQFYQLTIVVKAARLLVGTDRRGRYFAFRLRPSGKTMYWDENQENFYGPSGFLARTGVRGVTILVRLALGLPCINKGRRHSQGYTSIGKCSNFMTLIWLVPTREKSLK